MDLRTRILIGYGYLVSLIVISAVTAALGFYNLGSRLSEVLNENFASVRWSMEMVEALERQDSALLAALLGDDNVNGAISESETMFLEALDRARSNVTEDREMSVVDEIDREYRAYQKARDRLFAQRHDQPLAAYHQKAFPQFESVKRSVVELLDLNHQAMIAADEAARATAKRRASGHGLVVVIALVSFAWLSRALRRDVLARLANLKSVAGAMASGNLKRRADATRPDELGLLAEQLNSLLDRGEELRGRMKGRLAAAQDLVLGVLAARQGRGVLFAPDGRVVASTVADEELEPAREALVRFRSDVDVGDSPFEIVELRAGARSVGWLVSRREPEAET